MCTPNTTYPLSEERHTSFLTARHPAIICPGTGAQTENTDHKTGIPRFPKTSLM